MDENHNPRVLAEKCAAAMWPNDRASHSLDLKLIAMDEGRAIMSMEVKEYMLNGYSLCHGGYIFTLADSTFAYACNSQNHAAVASSCGIDYLQPAGLGDILTARADMLHQSSRTGLYDIVISNAGGDVVARFRGRSTRINKSVLSGETKHE